MIKNILKKTIFAGLFLVPLIPFLVSSSLFFPFITTKAFVWRILVEVIFAAWVLLAISSPEYRPKKSPILYAVAAFLAIIGIADIFGVDPGRSFWSNFERMEGFISFIHLGMYFLVAGSFLREVEWKRWWNTSLATSFLMVIYGLFQLAGVATIHQGGVRLDGTFGNASYLAVYMLIHIFLALLFLWRERENSALRWMYGLLAASQIFILYHTATRGAILGLLGGLLITAVLNLKNKEERLLRRASIGIIVALVAISGGFFLLKNTSFVQKSPVLGRFTSISTEELKGGGRAFVWPMALKGFKENPILGWGQENFPSVFQKYYNPEMYKLEPWFDRAHSVILDWLVAGGLLGLVSYLALYAAFLYLVWQRDGALSHTDKSVLTGMIAAYFFHNFFVFDHLVSYILFFSLLSYIHSRHQGSLLWEKNWSESSMKMIGVPAISVLLILSVYFMNVKPLQVNFSLIKALQSLQTPGQMPLAEASFQKAEGVSSLGRVEAAEQIAANTPAILQSDLPMEEKNKFFDFAQNVIIKEAELSKNDAKFQLAAGSFFASLGSLDKALTYLNRAKELIPGKQQVYFELGSAYVSKNDSTQALIYFKQAYDMAPESLEAKVIYLIGAIYADDRALERSTISQLDEKTVVFDDRVISAYYAKRRLPEMIQIFERRKELDPANVATYDEYIRQVNALK